MASYSIVLNLTGNAVTQSARLADNLWRAQSAAARLATNLQAVNLAARSIPASPLKDYAGKTIRVKQSIESSRSGGVRSTSHTQEGRGHSRGGSNPFISGRGVQLPFGRLNQIWTFKDGDEILGIDANKFLKGLNIAGIVTSLSTSIGKVLLKATAYSAVAPYVVGGGGLLLANRALQSEGFASGVRLLTRRTQAKRVLGEQYGQAEDNADYIAASYGLDRSTTLSSISAITGMGVGGSTKNRLSLSDATNLSKIGGILAQQNGVPFERVMTNLQQLFAQTTPQLRDIRELLTQSPILQKYAIDEMSKKGVTGDPRDFLKSQAELANVLKRYELDTAANAGMQARGQVQLALQDMWAKVASNDNFWRLIGFTSQSTLGGIGGAANSVMNSLEKSPEFRNMLNKITLMFENIERNGGTFITKLINLIDAAAARLGLNLGDDASAREMSQSQMAAKAAMGATIPTLYKNSGLYEEWKKNTLNANLTGETERSAFESDMQRLAAKYSYDSETLRRAVVHNGRYQNIGDVDWVDRFAPGVSANIGKANYDAIYDYASSNFNTGQYFTYQDPEAKRILDASPNRKFSKGNFQSRFLPELDLFSAFGLDNPLNPIKSQFVRMSNKGAFAPSTRVDRNVFTDAMLGDIIKERNMSSTLKLNEGKTGADGEDLKGFNRDRKALEIHFHAPIVEWNSTIEAANPQETVETIAQDVEQIMSAGLQKALLGASNKMSSSWY